MSLFSWYNDPAKWYKMKKVQDGMFRRVPEGEKYKIGTSLDEKEEQPHLESLLKTLDNARFLLAEVPLQQPRKGLAVTGFVAGHLVDGVVDGVEVEGLGALGEVGLAGGGAVFGFHAHLQVLLGGVGQHLTQQLCELGGVIGLLESGGLPVLADLGIALAEGDAAHGQIHAHLGALAVEIGAQIRDDVLGSALGHAHHVLSRPAHLLGLLDELAGGRLADGAELGGSLALVHIAADGTDKLLHKMILLVDVVLWIHQATPII